MGEGGSEQLLANEEACFICPVVTVIPRSLIFETRQVHVQHTGNE